MAKKRKGKYPNLDLSQNTKKRTDYIEPDYVDGVKDSKGETVIRPLTEEEKAWLNKFYGEYIVGSDVQLNPTEETKQYMKQKKNIKSEIAQIKRDLNQNKRLIKENKRIAFLETKIKDIEKCLDFLREEAGVFHPTCDEQRKLYNENNTRNLCIFNNTKARGMLLDFTEATLDPFIAKYWDTLAGFDYDSQDALIDIVEERLREQGWLEDTNTENFGDSSSDTDNGSEES